MNYLSEIVVDEELKKIWNIIKDADASSLNTLASNAKTSLDNIQNSFSSLTSNITSVWIDAVTEVFSQSTTTGIQNSMQACSTPAFEVLSVTSGDVTSLIAELNGYINEVEEHNLYYSNYKALLSQEPSKTDKNYDSLYASWNSKKSSYETYLKTTFENTEIYKENSDILIENIKSNLSDLGTISSVSRVSVSLSGIKTAEKPEIVDSTIVKETYEEVYTPGTTTVSTNNPTKGTYTVESYKDPETGKYIKYNIFVPDGCKEGSPVMLYIDNGGHGIHEQFTSGNMKSSGIVIYVDPASGDYRNETYLKSLKNLTDNVVTTYNADKDRISVAGFSLGGQATIKMASMYPGYFSVAVPLSAKVSSKSGVTQSGFTEMIPKGKTEEFLAALSKTPIIAFSGDSSGDKEQILWRQQDLEAAMHQRGYNYVLNVIKGLGHRTYRTFLESYQGYDNVLEYAMAQSKSTTSA